MTPSVPEPRTGERRASPPGIARPVFICRLHGVHRRAAHAGTPAGMSEQTVKDKRLESLRRRLQDELVDEEGRPAEPNDVESVVAAKAAGLAEAPVQEFVPLLVEHQARDELRQHGLHRELPEEIPEPAEDNEATD